MMKTLTKQILFTSLLISSSQAFARGPSLDQNTMNTLNGDTAHNSQNYSTPPTNTTSGSNSGSTAALISKVVTIGVAGYTGHICVASSGTNFMACVMAAQSLAQIAMSGSGSDNANNYGAQYKPYDPNAANYPGAANIPSYDPNNLNDPNNPKSPNYIKPNADNSSGDNSKTDSNNPYKGLTANEKSQLQKLKSDLAHSGISIDDKAGVVKFADGKMLSLKSSPADLKAAGYDGAQIDKTLSDVQAYGANLAAKTSAANGGGVPALTFGNPGGGGSHGAGSGSASNNNSNIDLNALMNGGRKPSAIDKQGVAGLSRKLGDESIGVKGDNIFEMVNRRYRAQDKQNAFLRDK